MTLILMFFGNSLSEASRDFAHVRLQFATACSALKHTIPGDFNMISEKEGLDLMNGNGNGRVKR